MKQQRSNESRNECYLSECLFQWKSCLKLNNILSDAYLFYLTMAGNKQIDLNICSAIFSLDNGHALNMEPRQHPRQTLHSFQSSSMVFRHNRLQQ